MPAIVGSLVGAILSFLGKAVGFIAEHKWVLIVFVAGFIGVWLMQRAKKDKVFVSVFFHDRIKVMKSLFLLIIKYSRYSVAYNSSCVKSINLNLLYLRST